MAHSFFIGNIVPQKSQIKHPNCQTGMYNFMSPVEKATYRMHKEMTAFENYARIHVDK